MDKKSVVLSISLLVSGRKETRKCLDSLKPIMEQIPCELILVDTGCEGETKALLEEYTDKIIPFVWCADFSKARNAGLEKSSGEWFLYLDDDEWFEDASEIIQFFQSGEYKKYQSACYKQRNYANYQRTTYMDSYVSRMIKRESNTRFVSSIHEYLAPFKGPTRLFETYVEHFGYVFDTEKEKYAHSKRNVDLLLDMIKKEPMNSRWDIQLLQEYWGMGEVEKTIEIALKGIAKFRKRNQKDTNEIRALGTMYGYLVKAYGRKYDYAMQAKYLKEAFEEQKLTQCAQAYLYWCAAVMHYGQENYEKCVAAFEKYMGIYKKIGANQELIYMQGGLLVGEAFQKRTYEDMVLFGIMASVKIGREDILEEYFYQLGWNDTVMWIHPDLMKIVITHMAETPFRESYVKMAKTMAERPNNIDGVVVILQEAEKEIRTFEEEKGLPEWQEKGEAGICAERERRRQQFNRLVRLFSFVEHAHWYITYLKILQKKESGEQEELLPLFDRLFRQVFDIFNLDTVIWETAEKYHLDLEPFLLRINFDTWRNGVCQWIRYSDTADIQYKEKQVRKWKKNEDIRYDFLFMKIKEGYLLHCEKEQEELLKLEQKLFDFAHAVSGFYRRFYKEETFREHSEMLPQECRMAEKLLEVEEARNMGEEKQVVEKLKQVGSSYQPLNETIKSYARKYGAYVEENAKKAESARKELQSLARALKREVKGFLEEGKYIEAKAVLEQVIQYVPEDMEAQELLKKANLVFH